MRIEDYPAQEPFTVIGERYHREVMQRGAGVEAVERAYGPDPYQRIAIVPADRPNGLVLVALHGGGWTNGYKEWMLFMAPAFTPFGITFVSVGYRLAPQTVFPNGYEDVLAGLALVHECVAEWGGDAARIFLTGHSAGGHLAALAAVRDDWQGPRNLPRACGAGRAADLRHLFVRARVGLEHASTLSRTAGPRARGRRLTAEFRACRASADPHRDG